MGEIKEEAYDFLMYSYFGIVPRNKFNKSDCEYDEYRIRQCAHRAYRDLCRTLRYEENTEDNKNKFIEAVCNYIMANVDKLKEDSNFDSLHNKMCNTIKLIANDREDNKIFKEDFEYGQAQKWLNMTLKYMWLLGLWEDGKADLLHIPVDSYIMEAAWEDFKIGLPRKSRKPRSYDYSESASKKWSTWNETEYKAFQKDLQEKVTCPIEWEHNAWIEIAKDIMENQENE